MSELKTIEQPALEYLLTRFLAQNERAMLDHLLPWFLAQNLPEPVAALVIARMQGGQAAPLVSAPLQIAAPEQPSPDLSIPPSITPELTAELRDSVNSAVNSRNGKTGRPLSMTPAAIRLREKKAAETPEEREARKSAHAKRQRERNARLRAERAAKNGSEPAAPAGEERAGAGSVTEPLTPEWAARSYVIQQLEKRKRSGGKPSAEDTISTAHLRKLTGWSGADVSKFVQATLDEWETAQRQQKGGSVSLIEAIYGEESEETEEEVAA